jgi:hypothetical protein
VFESSVIQRIWGLRGRQQQEGGEIYIIMKEIHRAFGDESCRKGDAEMA